MTLRPRTAFAALVLGITAVGLGHGTGRRPADGRGDHGRRRVRRPTPMPSNAAPHAREATGPTRTSSPGQVRPTRRSSARHLAAKGLTTDPQGKLAKWPRQQARRRRRLRRAPRSTSTGTSSPTARTASSPRRRSTARSPCSTTPMRGSGFSLPPRRHRHDDERAPGTASLPASGAEPAEKAMKTALRKGTKGDLNLYIDQPRRRPAGWATVPDDERTTTLDGVVVLDSSLPGGSRGALQPGRHRDPRDRPLGRALPHVPGRLLGQRRLRRRHAGRGLAGVRVPDGPRHLHGHRPGPDQELHGLHRRLLHEHLHRGPDHPHAEPVAHLPRLTSSHGSWSTPTPDLRGR